MPRRAAAGRIALIIALALSAGPSAADWLMTQDGAKVETKGAWEVRGKLVVFTLANGQLSSMRVDKVDLEASRELTEAANRPPPPPPPKPEPAERQQPVLVLTNADIPQASKVPGVPVVKVPDGDEGDSPGGSEGSGEAASPALEVASWNVVDRTSPDVEIVGTLRNTSDAIVTGIVLLVRVYDGDEKMIAETPALFNPTSLAPNGTVNFRALFPGVYGLATASFEIRSSGGWRLARPPEALPSTDLQ